MCAIRTCPKSARVTLCACARARVRVRMRTWASVRAQACACVRVRVRVREPRREEGAEEVAEVDCVVGPIQVHRQDGCVHDDTHTKAVTESLLYR